MASAKLFCRIINLKRLGQNVKLIKKKKKARNQTRASAGPFNHNSKAKHWVEKMPPLCTLSHKMLNFHFLMVLFLLHLPYDYDNFFVCNFAVHKKNMESWKLPITGYSPKNHKNKSSNRLNTFSILRANCIWFRFGVHLIRSNQPIHVLDFWATWI